LEGGEIQSVAVLTDGKTVGTINLTILAGYLSVKPLFGVALCVVTRVTELRRAGDPPKPKFGSSVTENFINR